VVGAQACKLPPDGFLAEQDERAAHDKCWVKISGCSRVGAAGDSVCSKAKKTRGRPDNQPQVAGSGAQRLWNNIEPNAGVLISST
jgi:hypothetical protein